jgi:acetyl esterase/lipase
MLCWLQRALLMALFGASGTAFGEHQVIRIWPGSAPGSETWTHREIEFYAKPLPSPPPMKMVRDGVTPTLTVYRPTAASATGTAILICPGGAFRLLDWVNEGTNAAEWLAAHGVTAFVLKYRLVQTPAAPEEFDRAMAMLGHVQSNSPPKGLKDIFGDAESLNGLALGTADARQALKVVRQRAREWGVAFDRIGILGFSSGAFVTMGAVMEHDAASRPNFVAAIYGGETGGRPIPADAPPLFVAVAQNDQVGLAGISERLYSEWNAAKLPAELHIFAQGGHGFGTIKQNMPVDHWMDLFCHWLGAQGLLKAGVSAIECDPAAR